MENLSAGADRCIVSAVDLVWSSDRRPRVRHPRDRRGEGRGRTRPGTGPGSDPGPTRRERLRRDAWFGHVIHSPAGATSVHPPSRWRTSAREVAAPVRRPRPATGRTGPSTVRPAFRGSPVPSCLQILTEDGGWRRRVTLRSRRCEGTCERRLRRGRRHLVGTVRRHRGACGVAGARRARRGTVRRRSAHRRP